MAATECRHVQDEQYGVWTVELRETDFGLEARICNPTSDHVASVELPDGERTVSVPTEERRRNEAILVTALDIGVEMIIDACRDVDFRNFADFCNPDA